MEIYYVETDDVVQIITNDTTIDLQPNVLAVALKQEGTDDATLFRDMSFNAGDSMLTFGGEMAGLSNAIVVTRKVNSIPVAFAGVGTKKIVVIRTIIKGVKNCNI